MNIKNFVSVLTILLIISNSLNGVQPFRAPGQPSHKPISKQDQIKKRELEDQKQYLVTVNKRVNKSGEPEEYDINVKIASGKNLPGTTFDHRFEKQPLRPRNRNIGVTAGTKEEELGVPFGEWWD